MFTEQLFIYDDTYCCLAAHDGVDFFLFFFDSYVCFRLEIAPAEELVEKMSNLARNLRAAPFERAFNALINGTTGDLEPVTLNYRQNEQACECHGICFFFLIY